MAIKLSLAFIQLSSLGKLSFHLQKLVENKLWLQVLIGLILGLIAGVIIGPDLDFIEPDTSMIISSWLAFPGHLFLAMIQMIVVPLVLASVMRGLTAASDMKQLKLLGLYGGLFFLVMTTVASGIGVLLAELIHFEQFLDMGALQASVNVDTASTISNGTSMPALSDFPMQIVNLLPNNPLQSFSSGDMLRIVIFAIVFGIALLSVAPEKSAPLYDLLGSIQEVCMAIVGWAMRIAPFAVFGLIAKLTSTVGVHVLGGMLIYVLTVICGLIIMGLIYALIVVFNTRYSLLQFITHSREVLLLAFSTSSSAAVMPLTIKTLEDKFNVDSATVRFLVPLGATVNMSGTALYQSVATIFLATIFNVDLDATALLLIIAMTIFASMGSPATPGASIVILAMMLENIGIPQAGLALLLGVDRLLDMCRTVINVMGDMTASIIVSHKVAYTESLDQ